MSPNFLLAFDRLCSPTHEGDRYVNDLHDPGGETKFGISKRSYPALDIAALNRNAAKTIYHSDFWGAVERMGIPSCLEFLVFDFAVNSGHSTAVRYLQRSVGVADDGHWGPRSAAATVAMDVLAVGVIYNGQRLNFMKKLKNWPYANGGWTARIEANYRYFIEDFRSFRG